MRTTYEDRPTVEELTKKIDDEKAAHAVTAKEPANLKRAAETSGSTGATPTNGTGTASETTTT